MVCKRTSRYWRVCIYYTAFGEPQADILITSAADLLVSVVKYLSIGTENKYIALDASLALSPMMIAMKSTHGSVLIKHSAVRLCIAALC